MAIVIRDSLSGKDSQMQLSRDEKILQIDAFITVCKEQKLSVLKKCLPASMSGQDRKETSQFYAVGPGILYMIDCSPDLAKALEVKIKCIPIYSHPDEQKHILLPIFETCMGPHIMNIENTLEGIATKPSPRT